MIDKEVNLEKLTEEIYGLTARQTLYVGFSIYYYYRFFSNPHKDPEFSLKNPLRKDDEVMPHLSELINNVKMYKNVFGLMQFFNDVVKGDDMHKEANHKISENCGTYVQTIELLDNLGISYPNGQKDIITPILPGLFIDEFKAAVEDNIERGSIEDGMYEERLFTESFFNFSRNIHLNPVDKVNVDIKKMISFLKRFPDFVITKAFKDIYYLLPKILKSTKKEIDEECDMKNLMSLNWINYPFLLQQLEDNVLYRHREASSSCDFTFVQKITKKSKLFLFFQIKNSKADINIIEEYSKVFEATKLQNFEEGCKNNSRLRAEEGCIYRLIIFNSKLTKEITFDANEPYRVLHFNNGKIEQLLEEYDEMNKPFLLYYVNPSEIQKFKQSKAVF